MNFKLLQKVAEKLGKSRLMDTKWQNSECEVIASQTIRACNSNYQNHGDAFSWVGCNVVRGRARCGTDNASGLARLIADGSLVQEDYTGPLTPIEDVHYENDKPQVLRVTDSLLEYVDNFIG